jgi:hypothetical protein
MAGRIIAVAVLVLALGGLFFVASGAGSGKSESTTRAPKEVPEIGRHVAVRVTPEEIVIIDTVTGELYRALNSDIKPYKEIFPTEAKEEEAE